MYSITPPKAVEMQQVDGMQGRYFGAQTLHQGKFQLLNNRTDDASFRVKLATQDSIQSLKLDLFAFDVDSALAKDILFVVEWEHITFYYNLFHALST